MKKIHFPFAVLVALALPLAALGATETVDGIEWSYDGTTLTGGASGNVVIPSVLGGNPIRTIGDYAFAGYEGLTSVIIPDSVTSIGNSAFFLCSGLRSVSIPGSVTSIGDWAFEGCSGLASMTIPDSVTSIGTYAICGSGLKTLYVSAWWKGSDMFSYLALPSGCRVLDWNTEIVSGVEWAYSTDNGQAIVIAGPTNGIADIPPEIGGLPVVAIGENAFCDAHGLTQVTIPNGVISIGNSAFHGCTNLTSVMISESTTDLGDSAFSGCIALTSVTIPDSVTSIGDSVFYGCSGLTNVTFPTGVTSIGNSAFSGCIALTSVTIPDSVTFIDNLALADCGSLRSVTIGNSVTTIGTNAFAGCTNLEQIICRGGVPSGFPVPFGIRVLFPEEYASEWNQYFQSLDEVEDEVDVLSSQIRETDPTILDVVYKVKSMNETVDVRALAFEDGVRSFSKVVRPETFVDGTGANLGDNIAANVEHTLSWRISADWAVDVAEVGFEILVSHECQFPLDLVTIPAVGTNAAMTINVRPPADTNVLFNALLWRYADHAADLRVENGKLMHGTNILVNGTSLYSANCLASCKYLYGKMGFGVLEGDELEYARSATRQSLETTTAFPYGIWRGTEPVTLFSNPANASSSVSSDWTYTIAGASSDYLQLTSTGHSIVSEAVDTSACTGLCLSFKVRTYNGTSGDSNILLVQYSTDNGTSWADIGTVNATTNKLVSISLDASVAASLPSVRFRFSVPGATGSRGIGISSIDLVGSVPVTDGPFSSGISVSGLSLFAEEAATGIPATGSKAGRRD